MKNLLSFLLGVVVSLGVAYVVDLQRPLGAVLPQAPAVFETSLQSPITSSATSMTLTANAIRGGDTLSGYNCFTIDEGSAQAEFVCGTVSGTSVTSMLRGVKPSTGTTTTATLQFAHRRGANVKITDFPVIQILKAQNSGQDTFQNILYYDSTSAVCDGTVSNYAICGKAYIDGVAVSGASNANETTKGIIELATALEHASSTSLGATGAALVGQSKFATDTPQYGCAVGYTATAGAGCSVVAQLTGKIRQTFLNLTEAWSVSGAWVFSNTVSIAGSVAFPLTINTQAYTFPANDGTASSTVLMTNGSGALTWNVPRVNVLLQDGTTYSSANTATTTVKTLTLPIGTLDNNDTLEVDFFFSRTAGSASEVLANLGFGNGTATTTFVEIKGSGTDCEAIGCHVKARISFLNSATSQRNYSELFDPNTGSAVGQLFASTTASAFNNAAQLYLAFQTQSRNGADTTGISSITVKLVKP